MYDLLLFLIQNYSFLFKNRTCTIFVKMFFLLVYLITFWQQKTISKMIKNINENEHMQKLKWIK